jgi:hypothetical protein
MVYTIVVHLYAKADKDAIAKLKAKLVEASRVYSKVCWRESEGGVCGMQWNRVVWNGYGMEWKWSGEKANGRTG